MENLLSHAASTGSDRAEWVSDIDDGMNLGVPSGAVCIFHPRASRLPEKPEAAFSVPSGLRNFCKDGVCRPDAIAQVARQRKTNIDMRFMIHSLIIICIVVSSAETEIELR